MQRLAVVVVLLYAAFVHGERGLQQAAVDPGTPYWQVQTVVNELPAEVTVQPQPILPEAAPGVAGNCSNGAACSLPHGAALFRLCVPAQPSTVHIETLPGSTAPLNLSMYVYNVQDDPGPVSEGASPAEWGPAQSDFWAKATKTAEWAAAGNLQMCSTPDNPMLNACLSGPGCSWESGSLQCTTSSSGQALVKQNMAELTIQVQPLVGVSSQCYFVAVGSSEPGEFAAGLRVLALQAGDAGVYGPDVVPLVWQPLAQELMAASPTGVADDPLAGDPSLADPTEGSRLLPRMSPYDLKVLGIPPVDVNASLAQPIPPAWLRLNTPATAGCEACVSTGFFKDDINQLMFVYENLCFRQSEKAPVEGHVGTVYGGEGPTDTNLLVFNEDKSIVELDDLGNRECSDGSIPTTDNCLPPGQCNTTSDQCPAGTRYISLSEVTLDVPPGEGIACFSVAIGLDEPGFALAFIGLDVYSVAGPELDGEEL